MAKMYPKSISEYMPTDSERIVYQELKNQLPDTFEVFYSVEWTSFNEQNKKSQADFIVASPEYGFLCLEVKGGSYIRINDNAWYVGDGVHGERRLPVSPYDQAEKSMYYFKNYYSNKYNINYSGIYGAGVVFPFYSVDEDVIINNRDRICTIDFHDLNNIHEKIKKMFRAWGGNKYGRSFYTASEHKAFLELVRERIAISAAAGSLIKYKERQLDLINRVQDNYIYFLSNVTQFFIKGGAGTGKTWIAMKLASAESVAGTQKVLFICESEKLANMVRSKLDNRIDVFNVYQLFQLIIDDFNSFSPPRFEGVIDKIKVKIDKYDAIFVDEAQDFTEEWARIIRLLLRDSSKSRLGIFYDDVQVIKEDSFGDGFGILSKPYLLHENIRNTSNIYKWTAEKTNLGRDMIANPVEGPTPVTEYITEQGQLTLRLETLFKKYLIEEHLSNKSLIVLSDDIEKLLIEYKNGLARWHFSKDIVAAEDSILISSVQDFKGLEKDMVIYIHNIDTNENLNYIAYTRAKYYLIELVRTY